MTTAGSEEDRDCGRRRDEDKLLLKKYLDDFKIISLLVFF